MSKYADIGVRIEDSFLLEETGLRRLSAPVPRTIEEIEALHAQARQRADERRPMTANQGRTASPP